jgi:hypothetical protein
MIYFITHYMCYNQYYWTEDKENAPWSLKPAISRLK